MHKTLWIILVLSLMPVVAAADVVYLRNGKRYEGQVTRRGDKVIVKMAFATMELDAKDVIHIKKGPVKQAPTGTKPGPADLPSPRREFTIADATHPEPIAFVYMRSLMAAAPGADSHELRQQVERWQMAAHDRKRKAGMKWLSPRDFIRRRKAYLKHLDEANKHLRKSARHRSSKPETAEQKRSRAAAMTWLQTAAGSWADPPLRVFLLAVAAYHRGQYPTAEGYFRRCSQALPRIAMFHQGRGMALLAGGRHLEALAEFVTVVRLRPGDRDAFQVLKDSMAKVPGKETKSKIFRAAETLLGEYDLERMRRRTTRRGITWLAPEKSWYVRDDTLPVPTMDRFVLRQAVGVPVGRRTLLVDSAVVSDALAAHARIDEKTTARGKARRVGGSGRTTTGKLALLTVAGIEFTPVEAEIDDKRRDGDESKRPPLAKGQSVTAYGLGIYEQMGQAVRKISGTITHVDPNGTVQVSMQLLPGEAAGPILTEDNRLIGFLEGRTRVKADKGGPNRLIPLARISQLIKRARRSSSPSRFSRLKRKAPPAPAEGKFFVVHAIFGERFQEK